MFIGRSVTTNRVRVSVCAITLKASYTLNTPPCLDPAVFGVELERGGAAAGSARLALLLLDTSQHRAAAVAPRKDLLGAGECHVLAIGPYTMYFIQLNLRIFEVQGETP